MRGRGHGLPGRSDGAPAAVSRRTTATLKYSECHDCCSDVRSTGIVRQLRGASLRPSLRRLLPGSVTGRSFNRLMIELTLLGPHALRGSDGRELTSLPAQPKRFALLAYLALGAGGYHRRDTLAALFWPDLDQFAARRALRNTLYHLREALGEGPSSPAATTPCRSIPPR